MLRLLSLAILITCIAPAWGQQPPGLQLTLPQKIHAVTGVPINVYFDNIVLTQTPGDYRFVVSCDVGRTVDDRWTLTPSDEDVGDYSFGVAVHDADDKLLESKSSRLIVTADDAPHAQESIRLLIIGDSLTHASAYPNEIARLLSSDGNPKWRMLGTHRPSSAAERVAHEGYGGWTWSRFVNKFEPKPDGTHRKRSSPFVFLNKESKPQLDMPRYFDESCDGQRPDYVVIMLGINDCFSAPADDVAGIDARIDTMLASADQLLSAIRSAAPEAQIGFCLTTPPNARQEAFEANYGDRYTRWGWKRIQHRLVHRQIAYLTAKDDPQISLVPTQLNLDPVGGYPAGNGVHPNGEGYKQLGSTIYSWLKSKLAELDGELAAESRSVGAP